MQILLVDDSRSSLARLMQLLGQVWDVATAAFLDPECALARAIPLRNAAELARALRKLLDSVEAHQQKLVFASEQLLLREEEMAFRLSRALEYRDNDTVDHTYRVAAYSALIAERLGLPERELIALAATIAEGHHERFDGAGYPHGLKGCAIPLAARIVAVADVFDALTSERPYKKATPLDETLIAMQAERGRHFDPDCLDAFIAAVAELAGAPPTLAGLRRELERRFTGAPPDIRNSTPSAA